MRLFHFSDDPSIQSFTPRPVSVPSERGVGREWMNGPLVWAIDDAHQPMYFFPRECPRILLWRKGDTSQVDLDAWWGTRDVRMIAHMEWAWYDRFKAASLYRYELPPERFASLDDAGMWVSREAVTPTSMERIDDLAGALRAADVELRLMETLTPLRGVWDTSLHASGLRLRNAQGWSS